MLAEQYAEERYPSYDEAQALAYDPTLAPPHLAAPTRAEYDAPQMQAPAREYVPKMQAP